MNFRFIINILLALSLFCRCQEDEPCYASRGNHILLGSKVHLCLKVKTQNHTFVYAFPIVVDRFTALQITDIGNVIDGSGVVTLSLQYLNIVSQQMLLQNSSLGVYQNLVSLVLSSTNGVLSKSCASCLITGHQICIKQQCFKEGDLNHTKKLLVYVSWLGTDLIGQHFVSHTFRLKKLNRYALQNIYLSALILAQ